MLKDHILIGVVYNRNGIATWCIEAAKALLQAGKRVTIVTTRLDWLPEDLHAVAILAAPEKARNTWQKISGRLNWWLQFFISPSFNRAPLQTVFQQLESNGNQPDLLLVAQSDFLWPDAPVPQWVVARSWPVTLKGYLAKMKELKSQAWLPRLHDLLFWYKMDNKAYRQATGVLAITRRLGNELLQMGIRAKAVYPCIGMHSNGVEKRPGTVPRLLTAALHLGDKRKNIGWMVSALGNLKRNGISFELTLVGDYDDETQKSLEKELPGVRLTGRLNRQYLLDEMAGHDIFLFASLQENWGYVLVEAMAQGMVVFTPDVYPFDEMNSTRAARFEVDNAESFQQGLLRLLTEKGLQDECLLHQRNFLRYVSYSSFADEISLLNFKQ